MSETPQIEHFHLVQPDPYYPGNWYLYSGDKPARCRVWLSKDDGKTWIEVTDPNPVGVSSQNVHRFTYLVFSQDYLYWATDETPQNAKAVMVRAKRGEPLAVEVVGALGNECVRNAVITDYGLLCISEAKNSRSGGSYLHLFTTDGSVAPVGVIPRGPDPNLRTGFTVSLGSKVAVNHEFFTFGDRKMLSGVTETFLWRLR